MPWHRIVRADGSLAKGSRQRVLLESEGVPFRGSRVDMRVARAPDFGTAAGAPDVHAAAGVVPNRDGP